MAMHRRTFLTAAGALGVTAWAGPGRALAGKGGGHADRFRLSDSGSGRATGYAEANKIVTLGDRTHVAWLDSVKGRGFVVRIRTLNRTTGEWSPTHTIGDAHDNHGGPALTVDGEGYLHVAYYPHFQPMRYRRSVKPNDASQWTEAQQVGEECTYPTLMCAPDGTLLLTCREGHGNRTWALHLYRKPPEGPWEGPRKLVQARFDGYAHFQEALVWGSDHQTLHLSCRIYEKRGQLQTVGYMVSDDAGRTWRRADGQRLELPATAETVDVLARGSRGPDEPTLRCGAIAVGPDDRPRVLYSHRQSSGAALWLGEPGEDGKWQTRRVDEQLPEPWSGRPIIMPGGLTFTAEGRPFIVATAVAPSVPGQGTKAWGHPSSEVVCLRADRIDGPWTVQRLSEPDDQTPNWLPNIERPTGHNTVPERPGVIYTAGTRGKKNTQLLNNGVYWTRPSVG